MTDNKYDHAIHTDRAGGYNLGLDWAFVVLANYAHLITSTN